MLSGGVASNTELRRRIGELCASMPGKTNTFIDGLYTKGTRAHTQKELIHIQKNIFVYTCVYANNNDDDIDYGVYSKTMNSMYLYRRTQS